MDGFDNKKIISPYRYEIMHVNDQNVKMVSKMGVKIEDESSNGLFDKNRYKIYYEELNGNKVKYF